MPEAVLFETEQSMTREDVATYLRTVANNLEAGDAITLEAGAQAVTLESPARPTFEVKAEREGPVDGSGELSIELELEWNENAGDTDAGDGELTIE